MDSRRNESSAHSSTWAGPFSRYVIVNVEPTHVLLLQGATSTIVGISVLYTVDAYIILTFFKTVWLTMMLGIVSFVKKLLHLH